jgi:hypothetical protein
MSEPSRCYSPPSANRVGSGATSPELAAGGLKDLIAAPSGAFDNLEGGDVASLLTALARGRLTRVPSVASRPQSEQGWMKRPAALKCVYGRAPTAVRCLCVKAAAVASEARHLHRIANPPQSRRKAAKFRTFLTLNGLVNDGR